MLEAFTCFIEYAVKTQIVLGFAINFWESDNCEPVEMKEYKYI